jgi:hypothetical protein
MSEPQRVGSLEIVQDLSFQEREWRAQRIGWVVMALIVLAALLGLTGTGVFAGGTAGDETAPLEVEYSRIAELDAPAHLDARIAADAATGEAVKLRLDRSYLDGVEIERITPLPDDVETTADQIVYEFRVDTPGAPIEVSFDLRPSTFGVKQGSIGLTGGLVLDFTQLVLP